MSRRYVRGEKVAWEFYGEGPQFYDAGLPVCGGLRQFGSKNTAWSVYSDDFHKACLDEYRRRIAAGWAPEIARGCMPVEAMTKFWVAGFDRDWRAFLALRNDSHAQAEIRVFAQWIENYLSTKEKV